MPIKINELLGIGTLVVIFATPILGFCTDFYARRAKRIETGKAAGFVFVYIVFAVSTATYRLFLHRYFYNFKNFKNYSYFFNYFFLINFFYLIFSFNYFILYNFKIFEIIQNKIKIQEKIK